MSTPAGVTETTLYLVVQNMLVKGRDLDALGAYTLGLACTCPQAGGHAVIDVEPGLQLIYCAACGRPTNQPDVLGAYTKGDVAVYRGELVTVTGEPGPTGMVWCTTMDEPTRHVHPHVAQLNLED